MSDALLLGGLLAGLLLLDAALVRILARPPNA